jgi:hypothetical protein
MFGVRSRRRGTLLRTTVKEERFRNIARLLVDEKVAPVWFADMEYISWRGETKDLRFVPRVDPRQVLLVDDFEKYVHPGQEAQWLQVEHFDYPYSSEDRGLAEVFNALAARIAR